MKRMLSASFVASIIAVLCIMDAGVPINGYQVELDPIRFTEMELAGENDHTVHIRKANKRLANYAPDQFLEQTGNDNYRDAWSYIRTKRNPLPFAQPDPEPLLKKFGSLDSPKGYSVYDKPGYFRLSNLHSPDVFQYQ